MRSISTLFILFLFAHRCRLSLQNLALPLMLLQKWLTRQVQMIIAASKDQPHLSATMRPPSGDVLLKKTKWQHTLLNVMQEYLDITAHLSSLQVKEKQTTFLYGDVVGVVAAWRRQNWWLYLNWQITKTFVCIKVTSPPRPSPPSKTLVSNDKAAACKATQPTSEQLTASPYTTQRGGRGI